MLTWPTNLKYQIERDSYKIANLGLAPVATQAQSGKTRMRPQFTLRITTMQVTIIFEEEDDLAQFHDFIAKTGDGSLEFRMPVWIAARRTYEERTVQIKGGASGITEEVFAVDDARVSFSLDVRNL